MEKTLEQVLTSLYPKKTVKEALEDFKHIELTEQETDEAIFLAKRNKEKRMQEDKLSERTIENRKALTEFQWSYDQTSGFMLYRAAKVFEGKFGLDEDNRMLFDLLCYYFSNDRKFVSMAKNMGVENPSLDKGLLLFGGFGVGKTWMMKLFGKNQRQVFHMYNAKLIADQFQANGAEAIEKWVTKTQNPFNDPDSFYQKEAGLCIDDIGSEDTKKHYGNDKNVIGDLIELRYSKESCGLFLHATTNLNAQQLKDYYGGRVTSRMREIFNQIHLIGNDRRV